MSWLKLLTPGLRIKRWLFIAALGIAMLSYGGGSLVRRLLFETDTIPPRIIYVLTLQGVGQPFRDIFLLSVGMFFVVGGGYAAFRSALAPFPLPSTSEQWIDALAQHRQTQAGPGITVLGQGENLLQVLHSLKLITGDLTVIIVPPRDIEHLTPRTFARAAYPYVQSLTKPESSINRILSDDLQDEIGDVFLYAVVSAAGSADSSLLVSSDLLALDGDVISALRAGAVDSAGPSDAAIRKLIDCDSLIFALDDWQLLADTLDRYPALGRAIQLSRSIKLGILSPAEDTEPRESVRLVAGILQPRNIHFVLALDEAEDAPDWRRLLQNQEKVEGVRLLHLPVVVPESEKADVVPLTFATGLLALFNRYERRHRLRWHI